MPICPSLSPARPGPTTADQRGQLDVGRDYEKAFCSAVRHVRLDQRWMVVRRSTPCLPRWRRHVCQRRLLGHPGNIREALSQGKIVTLATNDADPADIPARQSRVPGRSREHDRDTSSCGMVIRDLGDAATGAAVELLPTTTSTTAGDVHSVRQLSRLPTRRSGN
jgi:hypothetical protein